MRSWRERFITEMERSTDSAHSHVATATGHDEHKLSSSPAVEAFAGRVPSDSPPPESR
jgi:hypothetical protein